MKAWRGLVLIAIAAPVLAEAAPLEAAPSAAIECLTPSVEARAKLVYPEIAFQRKGGGYVSVELEFRAPDREPRVKILEGNGDVALVPAVEEHVRQYRVPCMKAGDPPVRLQQKFVFTPNDGRKVSWSGLADVAQAAEAKAVACVRHIEPGSLPNYPTSAIRMPEGVVLARIRFTSADAPPAVTIVDPSPFPALGEAVESYAKGYRLPCFDGQAVEAVQYFSFHPDGERNRTALKDTSLVGFLRGVKDVAKEPRYFDLDQMSCPFEVRLVYRRPNLLNKVGEIGETVPARQPLLDWLATLRLSVSPKLENALLGDSMTISVPCGKIDL